MAQRRRRASRSSRAAGRRRSQSTRGGGASEPTKGNVAAVRDAVVRTVLAPLNAVMLTRRHIEEVVDDAVQRGRMTRDDAQHLMQSLLQRGAQQTDDFLADLERVLGRRGIEERAGDGRSGNRAASRSRNRQSAKLPIPDYDELSAAAVQERLNDLSDADLRKLRDYERRHANRKTVLDKIERKLS